MDKLEALATALACEIRDIKVVDEDTFIVDGREYIFLDEYEAEDEAFAAATQLAEKAMAPLAEEHKEYFRFEDFVDDHFSIQNVAKFQEIVIDDYWFYLREK